MSNGTELNSTCQAQHNLPLPHPSPCYPHDAPVTVVFLRSLAHIPASGPLHLLFPLPKELSRSVLTWYLDLSFTVRSCGRDAPGSHSAEQLPSLHTSSIHFNPQREFLFFNLSSKSSHEDISSRRARSCASSS